eukprot:2670616-Rhodomonas_salina.1
MPYSSTGISLPCTVLRMRYAMPGWPPTSPFGSTPTVLAVTQLLGSITARCFSRDKTELGLLARAAKNAIKGVRRDRVAACAVRRDRLILRRGRLILRRTPQNQAHNLAFVPGMQLIGGGGGRPVHEAAPSIALSAAEKARAAAP